MITKHIFRNTIKEILLNHMTDGNIRPGERLSLPGLAKELDVSVTPIREALTQLSETGIITYIPNRGFFVTELNEKEATHIYEAIAVLECAAVAKSNYSSKTLSKLTAINESFKQAKSPKEQLLLDRSFHQLLIEPYSNEYLKKTIEDIRIRVFMYELEFMDTTDGEASYQMHHKIIEAIRDNRINEATTILESNWSLSIEHILSNHQAQL